MRLPKTVREKLSYQVKMLVVTARRWSPQKQAQILRLARELEDLGL